METVKINEKEYNLDDLSDDTKSTIKSLAYVQAEIKRLEAKIAIHKTAQAAYAKVIEEAVKENEQT